MNDLVKPYQVEIHDGWMLESNMPNNCSRVIRPDGQTAVYRYQQTTNDEAFLLKWGYEEGLKAGKREVVDKIKTRLGLDEA